MTPELPNQSQTQESGFCSKCGAANSHSAAFCAECGALLPWAAPKTGAVPVAPPAPRADDAHTSNVSSIGSDRGESAISRCYSGGIEESERVVLSTRIAHRRNYCGSTGRALWGLCFCLC